MRYVSDAEREDLNEQFGASTTTDQIDQIYNQANAINLMNTASAMDTDISDAKAAVKTYVNSLPNLGDDRAGLLERINSGNLRDVAKAFNDAKTTDAQNLKTTQTNAKAKINNDLNRFNQDGKNFFKDQIDQMTTNDDVQSMLDFAVSYNKAPVSINIEYVDENSNVIHAGKTLNGKLLGDSFDARPYKLMTITSGSNTYTLDIERSTADSALFGMFGIHAKTLKFVYSKNVTPNPTPTPIPVNPVNPIPTDNNGGSSNDNSSTTKEPATVTVPNYVAVKGSVVYATKRIYLYKNGTFKKSQRIATYPKQKRTKRPMFVVTGYTRSKGGALRYKVRDVNHHSKAAGKRGYITANRKYVVNVYYKTMPKHKQITVINPKGVHSYKNKNLTKRNKTYKKGSHLRVKAIVKHNLTTRYQLTNGHYVTANKKLVIQGKY